MADSLSNWLALREPADTAARSTAAGPLEALQPFIRATADSAGNDHTLQVLDLAAGTGSNFRYLAARLPVNQQWLLVDHDPVLLAEAPARIASWGAAGGYEVRTEVNRVVIRGDELRWRVETRRVDLGALDTLDIFTGRHLVTASALLDLVSERWLGALAAHCRANGSAALFTLSYNGLSRSAPVEPEDDIVLDLFNAHQTRDKGLGGPAEGPDAVDCAERCFAAIGYRVQRKASDWVLTSEQRELQRQLIEGWAEAATETAPEMSATIQSWLARRLAHVNAGRSRVTVCHEDLAAWPP